MADGDFNVQIDTASSAKEIQEVFAGFNLMTQELRATEILQTDFVSNVSHEFKTPINAIEGYATLLQDSDNASQRTDGICGENPSQHKASIQFGERYFAALQD